MHVGVGIDCGEAVPVEGGFRGRALNLAARLCSRAGAGEVLASQEAVRLARVLPDVQYVSLGALEFKGFDRPIEAVRVVARDASGTAIVDLLAETIDAGPDRGAAVAVSA